MNTAEMRIVGRGWHAAEAEWVEQEVQRGLLLGIALARAQRRHGEHPHGPQAHQPRDVRPRQRGASRSASSAPTTRESVRCTSKMVYRVEPLNAGFFLAVEERGAKVEAILRAFLEISLSPSTSLASPPPSSRRPRPRRGGRGGGAWASDGAAGGRERGEGDANRRAGRRGRCARARARAGEDAAARRVRDHDDGVSRGF